MIVILNHNPMRKFHVVKSQKINENQILLYTLYDC